jgi:hypothetical protein
MKRRTFSRTLLHTLAGVGLGSRRAWAAPTQLEEKRLQNRLALWHNYAARTKTLLARVTTTRETSLLESPLVVTGTLAFSAPATLVTRDDGLGGSTTRFDAEGVRVTLNRTEGGREAVSAMSHAPAAAWVGDRLVRMFAPGDERDLVDGARFHIPRGRGYRLELMPPRGSVIRKVVRSITITLDPVAGAINEIAIAEAQGDRVHLRITDHRQNVPAEDIASFVEPA